MNYVVFDLEWNQPLSYKSTIRSPLWLKGEIIEIGAVKLNNKFNVVDTFKIMVTPKYYTKMKRNVSKITKIRTSDLQYGFPFEKALDYFRRWCGEKFVFLTWGYDDVPMLRDNLMLHNLSAEWIPKSYNIQPIFDNQITKENRQCSLFYAMEKLEEYQFEAHDALNDARSAARICMHLNMYEGFNSYASIKNKSKPTDDDYKHKKLYVSRIEAKSDFQTKKLVCPFCGEQVICDKWLSYKTDRVIAMTACTCGEEYFVRLKICRTENNMFYVNRKIYALDDKLRAYYDERLTKYTERNKRKKRSV